MALDKAQLKNRIISEMEALGATSSGPHSWVERMAQALANAVVDEIQTNATAEVSGGSSAGSWPVT